MDNLQEDDSERLAGGTFSPLAPLDGMVLFRLVCENAFGDWRRIVFSGDWNRPVGLD